MNETQLTKKLPLMVAGIVLGTFLIIFISSLLIGHKENAKIYQVRRDELGRLYCNIYYYELEKITPEDKNSFHKECLELIRNRIDKTASLSNIKTHYIKFGKKLTNYND